MSLQRRAAARQNGSDQVDGPTRIAIKNIEPSLFDYRNESQADKMRISKIRGLRPSREFALSRQAFGRTGLQRLRGASEGADIAPLFRHAETTRRDRRRWLTTQQYPT
ncbi:hypothetical protein [Pseudorhodoplanes sp.]|uniref:hypothetical protein n=1 Tax=Pseudorhodoplanes sp. TaxID=1934341 RepID=UPI003D0F091A